MEMTQTFSGVFNGANDFTKVGDGVLTLSGNNSSASYTGKLVLMLVQFLLQLTLI